MISQIIAAKVPHKLSRLIFFLKKAEAHINIS